MSRSKPQHAPMEQFAVKNNQIWIAGRPLSDIVEQYGSPIYIYAKQHIEQRVRDLRQTIPPELSIYYAVKANPMPALIEYMAEQVDGFDVASTGELELALKTPVPRENISFAGPGKTREELLQAVEAGIVIVAESIQQIHLIEQICSASGSTAKVALRVNPDFELKHSGLRMGGGAKQFGIDSEQIPGTLELMRSLGIPLRGFHVFTGSQSLNAQAIVETFDKTFDLVESLLSTHPDPLHWLNLGGGFGIPYFPGDPRLELEPIGEYLHGKLPGFKSRHPETELVLELGRYLVGEAGLYVCSILDRKVSRDQVFLITNGGMHHHLAASGNLGQVIRKNYPVIIGNKVHSEQTETVTVSGCLCMPLDILADKVNLPLAQIGDLVAVYQSGAYGFSSSPLGFLTHSAPKEILI